MKTVVFLLFELCAIINLLNEQLTQKLKEQLYLFLPTTRVLIHVG